MLIRAEDGKAYNVAHLTEFAVIEQAVEEGQEGQGAPEEPFRLEAERVSYYPRGDWDLGNGAITLARYATKDEADKALNRIVEKSGGSNLSPSKQPKISKPEISRPVSSSHRSFN